MKTLMVRLVMYVLLEQVKGDTLRLIRDPRFPAIQLSNSRCTLVATDDKQLISVIQTWMPSSPKIIVSRNKINLWGPDCPNLVLPLGAHCDHIVQGLPKFSSGLVVVVTSSETCYKCVRSITAWHRDVLEVRLNESQISRHTALRVEATRHATLYDRTLRVGLIRYPPFVSFPENKIFTNKDFEIADDMRRYLDGFEYQMLVHFARKFNFSMALMLRQEQELWGVEYANGSTSGLFSLVQAGTVDIAAGGFNWDLRYFTHVALTHPYKKTVVKFLSPRREAVRSWLALVQPFKLETWGALVAVMAAGAAVLYVAQWTEDGKRAADFTLSLLVSLSILAQQGDFTRQWTRGVRRSVLVGLQLSTLLLGACYCGLLVAVLTLEPETPQLDTPEQLAHSGLDYTDTDDIFPGQLSLSDDPHIRAILGRYKQSNSWRELTQRLSSGRTAFSIECLDTDFLCLPEDLSPDLLQRLHLSEEFVLTSEIALLLTPAFPLKRELDLEVLRLVQTGMLQEWERRVVAATPDRDMALIHRRQEALQPTSPMPLSLTHLRGPFMMLVFGLTLAIVVSIIEWLEFDYIIHPKEKN